MKPEPAAEAPSPAEHFADLAQQRAAGELGVWTFLVTEVLMFGGLFTAYALYRIEHEAAWAEASRRLPLAWGATNTAVLLVSSFSMARAVAAAEAGHRRAAALLLALTSALGVAFLAIKAHEYAEKLREHLVPGASFAWPDPLAGPAQLFFSLYFVMTSLHAVHLAVGIVLAGGAAVLVARGRLLVGRSAAVHYIGLYWHFVDVVWIFLFPLLYLVDRT